MTTGNDDDDDEEDWEWNSFLLYSVFPFIYILSSFLSSYILLPLLFTNKEQSDG